MSESLALSEQVQRVVDYSALTRRLAPWEVTRFRLKCAREKIAYPARSHPGLVDVLAAVGALVISLPVIVLELALLVFAVGSPATVAGTLVIGFGSIALAGPCLYLIWRDQPLAEVAASPWPQRFRIAEFARVNGFTHIAESAAPYAPADSRAVPGSGMATTRIIETDQPALEIANLRYTTLSWDNPVEVHIGYMALSRPPRTTAKSLGRLQQIFDESGLGITVRTSGEWVLLFSAAALDLGAPQTYRMLFWIATQVDRRRAPLEPVSTETFVAEARQVANLRADKFVRRLCVACLAIATAWALVVLIVQLQR